MFKERLSSPILVNSVIRKTTWHTITYDADILLVHFRLSNNASESDYKIRLTSNGIKATNCELNFTYNAINKKGLKYINKYIRSKIQLLLVSLMEMLKHYAETGDCLKHSSSRRAAVLLKKLPLTLKLKLLLNKIIMAIMIDKDKNKFVRGERISRISNIHIRN